MMWCRHRLGPVRYFFAVVLMVSFSTATSSSAPVPVIGILSQPLDSRKDTYIGASYVKWLEVGGARSIPIPFDASTALVKDILTQVDGVLFPGGSAPVPKAAMDIWAMLHHHYYPISDRVPLWGTCLGMEFIVQLASDNFQILGNGYNSTNVSLPLLDVQRVGLYRPHNIYEIVTHHTVAMNNHHLGISPEAFRKNEPLYKKWKVTSISLDLNGKPFVSTMEPIDRTANPIFAVQFHPEKNAFEYGLYPNTSMPFEAIDHSLEGIALSIHMASFFINLAADNIIDRHQKQNLPESKYRKAAVYPMVYTYPREVGFKFEEIYIIPPASSWDELTDDKKWESRWDEPEVQLPSLRGR